MLLFLAGKEGIKHVKGVDYFSVGCIDKHAGTTVLKSRDRLHCKLEVDERTVAEIFSLANIVNHARSPNEWKTEDAIQGNIRAHRDKK